MPPLWMSPLQMSPLWTPLLWTPPLQMPPLQIPSLRTPPLQMLQMPPFQMPPLRHVVRLPPPVRRACHPLPQAPSRQTSDMQAGTAPGCPHPSWAFPEKYISHIFPDSSAMSPSYTSPAKHPHSCPGFSAPASPYPFRSGFPHAPYAASGTALQNRIDPKSILPCLFRRREGNQSTMHIITTIMKTMIYSAHAHLFPRFIVQLHS